MVNGLIVNAIDNLPVTEDHLAGLRRWIELAGKIAVAPRLVYAGSSRYVRSGVEVLPWTSFS